MTDSITFDPARAEELRTQFAAAYIIEQAASELRNLHDGTANRLAVLIDDVARELPTFTRDEAHRAAFIRQLGRSGMVTEPEEPQESHEP